MSMAIAGEVFVGAAFASTVSFPTVSESILLTSLPLAALDIRCLFGGVASQTQVNRSSCAQRGMDIRCGVDESY
jgi:hypothetical protein